MVIPQAPDETISFVRGDIAMPCNVGYFTRTPQMSEPYVDAQIFPDLDVCFFNESENETIGPIAISNWGIGVFNYLFSDALAEYYIAASNTVGVPSANISYKKYRYPDDGTTALTQVVANPYPTQGYRIHSMRSYDNTCMGYFASNDGVTPALFAIDADSNTIEKMADVVGASLLGNFSSSIFWDLKICFCNLFATSEIGVIQFTPVPVGSPGIQTITPIDFGDPVLNGILYQNFDINNLRIGDYIYIHCHYDETGSGPLAQPFLLALKFDLSEFKKVFYESDDAVIQQMFVDEVANDDYAAALFAYSESENKIYLTGNTATTIDPTFLYGIQSSETIQPQTQYQLGEPVALGCWSPCANVSIYS